MKKIYISPVCEFFLTEQEEILEGSVVLSSGADDHTPDIHYLELTMVVVTLVVLKTLPKEAWFGITVQYLINTPMAAL
jgi:hypothetical protein